ncbi:MAG: ZIP family metal transporter, partial [Candidatus Aenigmarchaeota archaeon]|nr:ZIP family metal transporter [Candidatus Aenigmarchaeota archaeon]MDI6722390.1 ZIP family metal transporter [Candidatus Aenigmarchaeota archaeon]
QLELMETIILIIVATVIVSLVSFVGALTLFAKDKILKKGLPLLVSFAAGSMLGATFFDLLPEAMEFGSQYIFASILAGIVIFFFIEKIFHWHHHITKCRVHTVAYMNLIGDAVHNFIDGMIIAASFVISVPLGIISTIAIIFHEIPQEIGDFGVLIYGGFSKSRALLYNLLSAVTAIIGAVIFFAISSYFQNFISILIPFAAGAFIYIAVADLIPELQKEKSLRISLMQVMFFLVGIGIMQMINIAFK